MAGTSERITGPGERPNGDGEQHNGNGAVDPATLASVAGGNGDDDDDSFERDGAGNIVIGANGKPKRKRGRKAGGGNRGSSGGGSDSGSGARKASKSAHDLKASVDGLANVIGLFHMGIATVGKAPEFILTDDESKDLAKATVPVLEMFDWTPDPKYAVVGVLIYQLAKIEGPRFYLMRERLKEEAEQRRANAARPIN